MVEVIDLTTGQRVDTDRYTIGIQSIPTPGVHGLCDYWRP